MKERIVIHVDVNNAFLSWTAVEMLKNGSKIDIRSRYSVIGGDEKERKGIVVAKSYPCKNKGVTTGESLYLARRKCPYLEVYKSDFSVFKKYSNLMYNYLCNYSDKIERYSIDECFIEYTNSYKLFGDPVKIAYKIKEDIKKQFGFTVNVGVGNNKLCAKMASDFQKPDRVHTLFINEVPTKMWPLPVSDLFMIGRSTSKKLQELNITTIESLAHTKKEFLTKHFKSFGTLMWEYANGIDNSSVEYETTDPKSISTSTVLPYNYRDLDLISKVLKELSIETGKKLRNKNLYANNISIWLKYSDFNKYSKQKSLENSISTDKDIYAHSLTLFKSLWDPNRSIRGLCVGVSNLTETNLKQLSLFSNPTTINNNDKLQKTLDQIQSKYGNNVINYADMFQKKN